MARPTVALIVTSYFDASHADVLGTRLIEGYEWGGEHVLSRVEVVSMYLEQLGGHVRKDYRPDIGVQIADRNEVPCYPTVAEAIGRGQPGVNVDGVVIIGEHGDYERNEFGQTLYPRRRLFDAAVSTMIGAGRTVPVFNDKHLAWSFADAQAMVDTGRRLGIPLLAGSTIPLAWRIPSGTQWPLGAPMTGAVALGYGSTEGYGFHTLEGLQCHVERRAGGESGVSAVQALSGPAAAQACNNGIVDPDLLARALSRFDLTPEQEEQARRSVNDVFLVEYTDGLRAAAVHFDEVIGNFGAACRGPDQEMSCQTWLQGDPHGHFIFLNRQIESMLLSGVPPYPIERTLLTTGILDAAMHSRHDSGILRETPELAIGYQPADAVPDTGIELPIGVTAATGTSVTTPITHRRAP
jgi:hypothetical protein